MSFKMDLKEKMKKFKKIKIEEKIVDDIICDVCKKSCKFEVSGEDIPLFNYAVVEAEFGYGSVLDDIYDIIEDKHICEDCYIKLFKIQGN